MAIKRPGGGRASYAIVLKNKTIYDERIDLVNKDHAAGHPPDELFARMREIEKSLQPKPLLLGYTNFRLAEECHARKVKITPTAKLRDPYSAQRRLIRAVEALGQLPLTTATREQIEEQVAGVSEKRRYHVLGGINELLRYLKRDLRFDNPPRRRPEVVYIDVKVFLEKHEQLPRDYATYLGALFATGTRLGELPMTLYRGNTFWVNSQISRKGVVKPMKSKDIKEGPLVKGLIPFITRLNALGRDAVIQLRQEHHKHMLEASKAVLGVCIHDLRHSYAVYMAKNGIETKYIAEYIGNTEEVCRNYYSRYRPTNEELEDVFNRLK